MGQEVYVLLRQWAGGRVDIAGVYATEKAARFNAASLLNSEDRFFLSIHKQPLNDELVEGEI